MSASAPPPQPPAAPPTPPVPTPKETIAAWAGYAKDRYDAAAKRVDEFRNWARQLSGAIIVLIGFELTLLGRVLDLKPPYSQTLRVLALVFLLASIVSQTALLLWAFRVGYRISRFIGPESPSVLAQFIASSDEAQTTQYIGAYYAKAFDLFHAASEGIAKAVDRLTRFFSATLALLLVAVGLLVTLSLWPGAGAYTGNPMATPTPPTPAPGPTQAPSTTPAPAATPQPAPAAPATTPQAPALSPLLGTPTPGLSQPFSAQPTHNTHKI